MLLQALHLPDGMMKFTNSRQDHFMYRPPSLESLFALLEDLTGVKHVQRSDIKLVCGNTSAGVFKKNVYNPPVRHTQSAQNQTSENQSNAQPHVLSLAVDATHVTILMFVL